MRREKVLEFEWGPANDRFDLVGYTIETAATVTGHQPVGDDPFRFPVRNAQGPQRISCFLGRDIKVSDWSSSHEAEQAATSS